MCSGEGWVQAVNMPPPAIQTGCLPGVLPELGGWAGLLWCLCLHIKEALPHVMILDSLFGSTGLSGSFP